MARPVKGFGCRPVITYPRVLRAGVRKNEAGHAVFEYDRPSSLLGQFGDERVMALARDPSPALPPGTREALPAAALPWVSLAFAPKPD
jgi:hypothetical protein